PVSETILKDWRIVFIAMRISLLTPFCLGRFFFSGSFGAFIFAICSSVCFTFNSCSNMSANSLICSSGSFNLIKACACRSFIFFFFSFSCFIFVIFICITLFGIHVFAIYLCFHILMSLPNSHFFFIALPVTHQKLTQNDYSFHLLMKLLSIIVIFPYGLAHGE